MFNFINTLKTNNYREIKLESAAVPIFLLVVFIANPIIASVLSILAFIYDTKHYKVYSFIMSFTVGLLAYHMVPQSNFDILRIQADITGLSQVKYYGLKPFLIQSPEPARFLLDFFVYNLNNKYLIQLFSVWLGYFLIFFMIGDYAFRHKIGKASKAIVLTYIVSGFSAIYFFSGIYNYLAMILFSFAFYRDIYQRKSKYTTYLLYLLSPLLHNAMALPLLILFLYKLASEKFKASILFVLCICMVYIATPISLFSDKFSYLAIFSQYQAIIASYLGQPQRIDVVTQYTTTVLMLEISKIIVTAFLAFSYLKSKNDNHKKSSSFIIYLISSILVLSLSTPISLRFILIASLVGIPMLLEIVNKILAEKKYTFVIALLALSIMLIAYQQKLFLKVNYPSYIFSNNAINSLDRGSYE